jgi:tetraacyldisaccharide 4'-kinase
MTPAGALLWPLSVIYGAGARLRAWAYHSGILRQKRLRGVVVSVGNITVGGTGKTPMVAWAAQRFVDNGRKVGILARGYRPLQGAGAIHGAAAGWNDEIALLHARLGRQVDFGVGANRFERGKELEKRGVNCFVLDDGFQHQQLARHVNIVMIDATNPFGGGHVLPSGRLREPLSALRRAGIIVIHRVEKAPAVEAVIRRYSSAPIYFSQTKLLSVEAFGDAEITVAPAQRKKFFAFCGIGNPSSFLADLKRWDISVLGHRIFRDHHRYSPNDIASLSRQALAAGADALLCTEKDIYDLPSTAAMPVPIFFCKIALQFNDEEGLWRTILDLAEKSGGAR